MFRIQIVDPGLPYHREQFEQHVADEQRTTIEMFEYVSKIIRATRQREEYLRSTPFRTVVLAGK